MILELLKELRRSYRMFKLSTMIASLAFLDKRKVFYEVGFNSISNKILMNKVNGNRVTEIQDEQTKISYEKKWKEQEDKIEKLNILIESEINSIL